MNMTTNKKPTRKKRTTKKTTRTKELGTPLSALGVSSRGTVQPTNVAFLLLAASLSCTHEAHHRNPVRMLRRQELRTPRLWHAANTAPRLMLCQMRQLPRSSTVPQPCTTVVWRRTPRLGRTLTRCWNLTMSRCVCLVQHSCTHMVPTAALER
jgi:hypothetical protein